jgi:AmmeMemoRadiSam system protein B/AmmeMemoRadiSam system protein A
MYRRLSFLLLVIFGVFAGCGKAPEAQQTIAPIIHTTQLPAGWYAQETAQLHKEIDTYLAQAQQYFPYALTTTPVALVVPHAGHAYSGLCATSAYQTLLEANNKPNTTIKRVIILAPTHTTFYNGIALPDYTVYRMPFGDIQLDSQAIKSLSKKDAVFNTFAPAYTTEHAIEIQLPFLQRTIASFKLVPLIVGHITDEQIFQAAEALKKMLSPDTLLVISTDFTHHGASYDYNVFDSNISANIRVLDATAIRALAEPSFETFETFLRQTSATICGRDPLRILLTLLETGALGKPRAHLTCYYTSTQLQYAQKNGFDANKLFQNPPDTQAHTSVSYVGLVYAPEQAHFLTGYEQLSLLKLARNTIANAFEHDADKREKIALPLISPGLLTATGAFVTLTTKSGDLRGCIGNITTDKPLYSTIVAMAQAAAFNDTRFTPLRKDELDTIVIDITILTRPVKVASAEDIIIGKHGIILNKKGESGNTIASAVFLPQVAREQGWNLATTLEHLSQKAGLDRNAWKTDCDFEVFEGFEIKEQ